MQTKPEKLQKAACHVRNARWYCHSPVSELNFSCVAGELFCCEMPNVLKGTVSRLDVRLLTA